MAKIYAELIRKGLKIIKEVPEKLRAEVQAILDAESNAQTTIIFLWKGNGKVKKIYIVEELDGIEADGKGSDGDE